MLGELWAENPNGDFNAFIEENVGFTVDDQTGFRRPACLGSGDGQTYCMLCKFKYWC
jgi:hypothetical protein